MPLTPSYKQPTDNKRSARRHREADDEQISGARFYNRSLEKTVVRIDQGNCYITDREDEMLSTVLGSCVSACIRDPLLGIGGMNHFMLPASQNATWTAKVDLIAPHLRYGNFAMEQLINGILSRGGKRDRLEVKVFGGGNVLATGGKVGSNNADFVESYLAEEGLKIIAKDLRGDHPRKIQYFPTTGRVMVKKLNSSQNNNIIQREEIRRKQTHVVEEAGSIELWD